MRIYLESDVLIHKKYIFETERAIGDQLCFDVPLQVKIIEKFRLSGQYTAQKLLPVYRDSILLELKNYNMFLYNLFRSARCEFTDPDTMRLSMEDTVVARGKEEELLQILEKIFCERCGQTLKIEPELIKPKESQNRKLAQLKLEQEVAQICERVNRQKEEENGEEFLEAPAGQEQAPFRKPADSRTKAEPAAEKTAPPAPRARQGEAPREGPFQRERERREDRRAAASVARCGGLTIRMCWWDGTLRRTPFPLSRLWERWEKSPSGDRSRIWKPGRSGEKKLSSCWK